MLGGVTRHDGLFSYRAIFYDEVLMDTLTEIRPQLKLNTVFLQTKEGLLAQNEGNKFLLKGKAIARWISILSPYLTGEYTVDQLCHNLGADQCNQILRIIDMLLQKGLVKNVLPETADILSAAVSQQFRAQIAYINHFVDQPRQKFKVFRESSILITGSGESFLSLAQCLLRNGLEKLALAPTDGEERYVVPLTDETTLLSTGGSSVCVSFLNTVSPTAIENLDSYDVVVYCADHGSLQDIAVLNECCVREGRAFLAATILGEHAMLGPFVQPHTGPCWLCAQMRLSSNSDEKTRALLWSRIVLGNATDVPQTIQFSPLMRRMGHGLGFELFKILTGALPSETEQGVIFQHQDTLEAFHCKLTQHPLCPVCSHANHETSLQQLHEIILGERDRHLTHTEVYQKCSMLIDEHLGAFHSFADEAREQIPLKQTRILIGSPEPLVAKSFEATCFSTQSIHDARIATFIRAVELYTKALPDRRTMLMATPQAMSTEGKRALSPQAFFHWSGALSFKPDQHLAWVPAYSLFRQADVYVPAAAVYPASPLNAHALFECTTAGCAVDTTYCQTLTKGLLSALAYDQLRAFLQGLGVLRFLDVNLLPSSDSDLNFLLKSAKRLTSSFTVFVLQGDAPLPIVIVRTTETSEHPWTTFGFGLSLFDALKLALLNFVGGLQVLQSEETLPASLSTFFPEALPLNDLMSTIEQYHTFGQVETTIEAIEIYLQKTERDVLFVDTTTADIRAMDTLISGTVLLTSKLVGGFSC
jgi:bacteriocin biosynthesis cyclodehydratase domain-containing protein